LARCWSEGDELSPLKRLIGELTAGNPFFIKEIAQGLSEKGALVRNGNVRITRSLSHLRLPPTVLETLAAGVDLTPRPQKHLLQTPRRLSGGRCAYAWCTSHICSRSAAQRESGGFLRCRVFL
jgi:hypothetical protein